MSALLQKLSMSRLIMAATILTGLSLSAGGIVAKQMELSLVDTIAVCAVLFGFSVAIAWTIGRHVGRRATCFAQALNALANGDLSQSCAISGKDEFAWFSYEYSCARKAISQMVSTINENAEALTSAAVRLSEVTESTKQGLTQQNSETRSVVTSMDRMSDTVQEVANHANEAAGAAKEADQQAGMGNRLVHDTLSAIKQLADEFNRTSEVITSLKSDTINIGAVLDAIRGISEQTNLLALNAAIEAARAGEQGRGFAVVADEVRTLASRTQQSTSDIQGMIETLQERANKAVQAMSQGSQRTTRCIEDAEKAGVALQAIANAVNNINDMNTQIADRAQFQRTTVEEINQNVLNIGEIAAQTQTGASQTSDASRDLSELADRLNRAVTKFKLAS